MKIESNKPLKTRVDGLVSVIMPAHNARGFIGETIRSVVVQTYECWEILIVDDCSDDGTAEFVRNEFDSLENKLRVFSLDRNSGPAVARNKAIENSKGQYIAFLDSDDLWLPSKLEVQIEFMKRKNISFSFTSFNKINEKGAVVGVVEIPGANERISYGQLLKANIVQTSTAIYDTNKLGIINMPLIRRRQDFGLWLKILKMTESGYPLRKILTSYRVRSGSLSSNKFISAQYTWYVYRDVEKLSFPIATWYFINYLVRTGLKYFHARRFR